VTLLVRVLALSPGQGVRGLCESRRPVWSERTSFTRTRQFQTQGNRQKPALRT